MKIEEKIKDKINELIISGNTLGRGDQYGADINDQHKGQCVGWLISAQNVLHLIISDPTNPYKISVEQLCANLKHTRINPIVSRVNETLKLLIKDIEAGLITSLEDKTKATVFDDFLDHAKEYAKNNLPKEAGVISGVVFEDTLRSICRNQNIEEKKKSLENLISTLVKTNTISQIKAKRARTAASVRTSATHARWEDFDIKDVNTTIDFTEELISVHLDK